MKLARSRRGNTVTAARRMLLLLAASQVVVGCSLTDQPIDSFDAPLETVIVDLGPSPYFEDPDVRITLKCYYHRHVMVKEYSEGGAGADGLSMVSGSEDRPECVLARLRGERVIDTSEWAGWFKGVKDALVFFDPPDAFNGHAPFAVFDSVSGAKIFEDVAYGESVRSSGYRTSRMQVVSTNDGYLLRYMRVVNADCDLNFEGDPCWDSIKAQLAVQTDDAPPCSGYDVIANLIGTDRVESVIAYPVEVSLSPRPEIKTVAGPAQCWAAQ